MAHLLVDISSHGFGHLAQTAPVLNELAKRLPNLHVTVRSGLSRKTLKTHIAGDFTHVEQATDLGMTMTNAVDIQIESSAAGYREFHRDWKNKVAHAASEIASLKPDMVLSNISYITLAASNYLGIPCIAMCSLNWADIYHHYCQGMPEADEIHEQMLVAYQSANIFLRPRPAMPMTNLKNTREIEPIARLGAERRSDIKSRLGLNSEHKLVMIAMGGIPMQLPLDTWPRTRNTSWLVPASWQAHHPDAVPIETLELPFVDVLRACDALISKPGYGTFAEAAVNGTPVLYLRRKDWPEEPYLVEWLSHNGCCLEIERNKLECGEISDQLNILFDVPQKPLVNPNGANSAAEILHARLSQILS